MYESRSVFSPATGSNSTHMRPVSGLLSESRRSQEFSPPAPAVNCQPDVPVSSSSIIRLEPFCLEPSTILKPNGVSLHQDLQGSGGAHPDLQGPRQVFSSQRPFTVSPAAPNTSRHPNPPNGSTAVVPLPDPPPNSCLKTGNLTNHRDSRSGSRVGLRVHFKLPEDEEDERDDSDEDLDLVSFCKEPPPVLAKPKL